MKSNPIYLLIIKNLEILYVKLLVYTLKINNDQIITKIILLLFKLSYNIVWYIIKLDSTVVKHTSRSSLHSKSKSCDKKRNVSNTKRHFSTAPQKSHFHRKFRNKPEAEPETRESTSLHHNQDRQSRRRISSNKRGTSSKKRASHKDSSHRYIERVSPVEFSSGDYNENMAMNLCFTCKTTAIK